MSEPKNKKKSRSGHKSYLTHALNKVDECVANYTPERKDELAQWTELLQEQLQKVTTLSDQILALMEAHEELTDDLSTESMDTNTLKFDVTMRLSATEKIVIANVANITNVPPSLPSPSADLHANQAPFNPWPPSFAYNDSLASLIWQHVLLEGARISEASYFLGKLG